MDPQKTQDKLQESFALVRDLLDRQRVVETMVHSQHVPKQDLVETLVQRQHLTELQTKVNRLHTADIAHILESLPPGDRLLVWDQVRKARGGEILLEVSDAVRQSLIAAMVPEELMELLNQLDADDLAYIAEDVPEDVLQQRLESLDTREQAWLRSSMNYEEDTVGYLMSSEMVVVNEADTVEQALGHLRRLSEFPAHTDKLFVVDQRGIFKGVLTLQSMLLNRTERRVSEIMATSVVKFVPEDDASEAAKAFERYDLVSAPIINGRGKLVGRLTVDVVVDYIREESTEDVLTMAGLRGEEDLFSPIWNSARNRGLWLLINLVTAFVASRVIGLFETTIAQLVALATLMPIVASVGGNTGNQTTALIVRGLALGQVKPDNTGYLLRKELGISLLNGSILGVAVGGFAFLLYQDLGLAAVIAVAMLLTLALAAMVGLAVPVVLQKVGRDPALGSSVLLTAATDSMGFFVFLGLATLFLV